jgi:hypothetical protein
VVFPRRSGHNSEDSSKYVEITKIGQSHAIRINSNQFKLLFLAFLPVGVLILGHVLFDIIGASFANYAVQLISHSTSAVMTESAIAAAQLWGSASLIYLVVGIGSIGYVVLFLRKNVKGKALFPFLGIAAFLIVIGISHLIWVDEGRRPLSMIFYLTYESLKASGLLSPDVVGSIKRVLDVINVLSVIIPSLFCAFMPSVLITPRGGWTENALASRIESGRRLCACSSVFLIVGIFHMFAWMRWSCAMLGSPELGQLVSGIVFFWGIVFSAMIATLYICIISVLNEHCESLDASWKSSSNSSPRLLSELGVVFNGLTQVKQALIVFGPVISAFAVSTSAPLIEAGV